LLGILFGYIFWRTGNLWYSIMGHALYNLVMLVRLDRASEEEIVSASAPLPDAMWTIVSLAAVICAFWLLRRLLAGARSRKKRGLGGPLSSTMSLDHLLENDRSLPMLISPLSIRMLNPHSGLLHTHAL